MLDIDLSLRSRFWPYIPQWSFGLVKGFVSSFPGFGGPTTHEAGGVTVETAKRKKLFVRDYSPAQLPAGSGRGLFLQWAKYILGSMASVEHDEDREDDVPPVR